MNYHISRNGQQYGTMPESEVQSRLQSGELSPNDLCWTEGMADWKTIGSTLPPLESASPSPSSFAPPVSATAVPLFSNPYAPPRAELGNQFQSRADLASLGQRLGAALLDALVAFIAFIPFIMASAMTEPVGAGTNPEVSPISMVFMSAGGLLLLALAIYNLVLLGSKGQTIGKKMLGIRIANNEDDKNPGFVKAFILRVLVNGFIGIIPLYSLIDICCIFNQERRCIHDMIAGTRVVKCD